MKTSLFELFKIGIGPSSSHTVGPMRAALRFVQELEAAGKLASVASVRIDLYGSLALTGHGHGTDRAVLLGLVGEAPDTIDPASMDAKLDAIRDAGKISLLGRHIVPFDAPTHFIFHRDQMYPDPRVASHPNGLRFSALDAIGSLLAETIFYSIGGGFIVSEAERLAGSVGSVPQRSVPYPFSNAAELLAAAAAHQLRIWQLMLRNECALLEQSQPEETEQAIRNKILDLWQAMQQCTERGMRIEGILPGGLNVRRRAPQLARRLQTQGSKDPLAPLDWITVYAMAVNEENAAGGRVVTAPTNGAAGVVPAVAHYYLHFVDDADMEGILRYFLTAAAIGILYKENASISGAEVGCQGEVGVACSMAAGGLVAALGGTNGQVEHAAEIAMEHNLGMTCDPIGGLVQIPCIERNAMGAVKAVNACRIAMHETEAHKVSLDQVIHTMYQTGLDMQSRYKETSLAGLALNVIEC
ncbi:MAG: L-serine ammonia-lyase [Acidobacteriaceae bacterium]